jgi:hypothetical protein
MISKCAIIGTAAASIVALAVPAGAATSSFGPQNWANGTATGRYRADYGAHKIVLSCSGPAKAIDLRVDVINNPDISEGTYAYTCSVAGYTGGNIDSKLPQYRGHFMQSHSSWSGTASDTHNS